MQIVFVLLVLLHFSCEADDSRTETGMGVNGQLIKNEQADNSASGSDATVDNPGQSGSQPPNQSPPQPIVVTSFDEVVGPLISESCGNCHQPDGSASKLVLETYEQVRSSHQSMISALENDADPMPPSASKEKREDIKKVLLDWKQANFLKSAP